MAQRRLFSLFMLLTLSPTGLGGSLSKRDPPYVKLAARKLSEEMNDLLAGLIGIVNRDLHRLLRTFQMSLPLSLAARSVR